MILKYKGYKGSWCYEELGSGFVSTHYGIVNIKEDIAQDISIEKQLEYISKESLESKILSYLHSELDLCESRSTSLITGGIESKCGSYRFVVVSTKEQSIVLLREAYLMTDMGKTIERLI